MDLSHRIYTHLLNGSDENMNVNGSITPAVFRYTCPTGFHAHLNRFLVHIVDTSMVHTTFGGLTALTNGVSFAIFDSNDNELLSLSPDHTITTNSDFASLCYDVRYTTKGALDSLNVRWTFTRDGGGRPLVMEAGDYIAMTINDNLTGLTEFHTQLRGFLTPA